jgi:hypothetical protein
MSQTPGPPHFRSRCALMLAALVSGTIEPCSLLEGSRVHTSLVRMNVLDQAGQKGPWKWSSYTQGRWIRPEDLAESTRFEGSAPVFQDHSCAVYGLARRSRQLSLGDLQTFRVLLCTGNQRECLICWAWRLGRRKCKNRTYIWRWNGVGWFEFKGTVMQQARNVCFVHLCRP